MRIALAACLLAACTTHAAAPPPATPAPARPLSEPDQVRLAVFRHQLDTAGDRPFVCLELSNGSDPAPELLAPLGEKALPASACKGSGPHVVTVSGQPAGDGIAFSVDKPEVHGDRAVVTGMSADGSTGTQFMYTLVRTDGTWEVTREAVTMSASQSFWTR